MNLRRGWLVWVWALFVAIVLVPRGGAQDAAPGPQVDAQLDAMRGPRVRLRDERGRRVVVLFFEDRPHVETNDAFKGRLRRFVDDNHLDARAVVYGVADLAEVGVVPETLVRSMISPLVERWNVNILLDWRGVMRAPPFSFHESNSTVALIDLEGRIVYRHEGAMDDTASREFYRVLRRSLPPPR